MPSASSTGVRRWLMSPPDISGTLWPAVLRQTAHALDCGALLPIETIRSTIEDGGVRFLIRQVSSLARKDEDQQIRKAKAANSRRPDPFLPYDPDLFVADISETHIALLNKFNVIDHHLLIVTRRFELQEALLNLAKVQPKARIVAVDALDGRLGGLVDALRSSGPAAQAHCKRLLASLRGHDALDPQVAEQTARSIAEVRAGDEAREGIAAFFAKRKPSWTA